MKHTLVPFLMLLALPGCATLFPKSASAPMTAPAGRDPATEMATSAGTAALGAKAVRADVLDTTSAAEKAAALSAPAASGEKALGKVVVALGPPAEQGLWLRTSQVTAVGQGRVETATGQSLTLELRPGTGGALLSLAAFQALGLNLTGLPEVAVFGP